MPHHTKPRPALAAFIAILAIALGVLAFLAWVRQVPNSTPGHGASPAPYPAAVNPSAPPSYVTSASGVVTSVGTNSITISSVSSGTANKKSLTVSIASGTTVYEQVPKSAATLQSEMATFKAAQQTGAASTSSVPTPPLPFTRKSIALSDIVPGMLVSISLVPQAIDSPATPSAMQVVVIGQPK